MSFLLETFPTFFLPSRYILCLSVDSGVDAEGVDGVGIVSIAKTGTVGLVDTYTITLSNGQTQTFTVTNGAAAVLPAGGTAQQVLMKNSSTDSDASWKDINTTASYKDMQAALGAPEGAGKNLLENTVTDGSATGINWTVNADDKSISVWGTATARVDIPFWTQKTGILPSGNYILSGCPSGGGASTYRIQLWDNTAQAGYNDTGAGVNVAYDATHTTTCQITIFSGANVGTQQNPTKFYPMIRVPGTSADYVPHSDSLQAQVEAKADDADIAPIENGTTASRTYKKGQHFWRDGDFCVATASISQGGSFTLNTNYTASNVGECVDNMNALLPAIDFSLKTPLSNANTAVDSGWYKLNDGATGSPYSGFGCYLLVLRMSIYCIQVCFANAQGSTGGTVYPPKMRHGWPAESQWTDWKTFTIS